MELIQILQEPWAVRALIASAMVGIMCGVLGTFIVLRNMSMIGDALSHAILPGVVFAFIFVGYSTFGFFVGAVIAGLFAAFGITWIQQNVKTKNDAAIGIVFTAMFSVGVIGISKLSRNSSVHLDLKDFLFGNVLTVSDEGVLLTAAVAVFVVSSIAVFYRYLFASTFQPVIARTMGMSVQGIHYFLMLLLSFAVVASLQTVGVILVVAMLITPASTALLLSKRLEKVVIISGALGFLSALLGLIAAVLLETTPGPAMAVVATSIYLLAALFAPEKGLIARYRASRVQQVKIEMEDMVKAAFKLEQFTLESLSSQLGFSPSKARRLAARLRAARLMTVSDGVLELTEAGVERAKGLIRAHRLWESYLVSEVGLTSEQIHEDAEQIEHHLSDDILDEVDRMLGYPTLDPHGSPIPPKGTTRTKRLDQFKVNESVIILEDQDSDKATHLLWELGIDPSSKVTIREITQRDILLASPDGDERRIPLKIASRIAVAPLAYSSSDPI